MPYGRLQGCARALVAARPPMRLQVDAPAAHTDALVNQQLSLPAPHLLCHGAVRTHHPVPGRARVHAGQCLADLPGRA